MRPYGGRCSSGGNRPGDGCTNWPFCQFVFVATGHNGYAPDGAVLRAANLQVNREHVMGRFFTLLVDVIRGRTGTAPLASNQAPCFPVSLLKLTVMSICTFGIYEAYWFYKNWNLIKQRRRSNIAPFWRAFFAYFFCYQCFDEIRQEARKRDLTSLPLVHSRRAGSLQPSAGSCPIRTGLSHSLHSFFCRFKRLRTASTQ
jgi:hypothetical protein